MTRKIWSCQLQWSRQTNGVSVIFARSVVRIPADHELFRHMVASLLHLASWTLIYNAFAVSELSQFEANPAKVHLDAAKRVLRYLKTTMHHRLVYQSPKTSLPNLVDVPSNTLRGYVDLAFLKLHRPPSLLTMRHALLGLSHALCA